MAKVTPNSAYFEAKPILARINAGSTSLRFSRTAPYWLRSSGIIPTQITLDSRSTKNRTILAEVANSGMVNVGRCPPKLVTFGMHPEILRGHRPETRNQPSELPI